MQKVKASPDIRRLSIYRNSCFVLSAPFVCRYLKKCDENSPSFSSSYVALQLLYRVSAFSDNSLRLLLTWARVFQFGTFNLCISFLTSSTQRVFGLPIGLLEMGFQEYIAFTILVPCLTVRWSVVVCVAFVQQFHSFYLVSAFSWRSMYQYTTISLYSV